MFGYQGIQNRISKEWRRPIPNGVHPVISAHLSRTLDGLFLITPFLSTADNHTGFSVLRNVMFFLSSLNLIVRQAQPPFYDMCRFLFFTAWSSFREMHLAWLRSAKLESCDTTQQQWLAHKILRHWRQHKIVRISPREFRRAAKHSKCDLVFSMVIWILNFPLLRSTLLQGNENVFISQIWHLTNPASCFHKRGARSPGESTFNKIVPHLFIRYRVVTNLVHLKGNHLKFGNANHGI